MDFPKPGHRGHGDRDGTIVIDREYLSDPAGLEFMPGAVEGLRSLHELG
jgi:D-glycero-D-manno-heptose 1,7-bisphosphate phosphatase